MMFCPNCGKRIPDDARFCAICGAPVADEQPSGIQTPSGSSMDDIEFWDVDDDETSYAAPARGTTRQAAPSRGIGQQAMPAARPTQQRMPARNAAPQDMPARRNTAQAVPGRANARQGMPAGRNAAQATPGRANAWQGMPAGRNAAQAAPGRANVRQDMPAGRSTAQAAPGRANARHDMSSGNAPRRANTANNASRRSAVDSRQARPTAPQRGSSHRAASSSAWSIPNIVSWVGALFILLSPFLPVMKAEVSDATQRANYLTFILVGSADGIYFVIMAILLLAASIAIAVMTYLQSRVPRIICAAVALLIGLFNFIIVHMYVSGTSNMGSSVSMLITILGAIAVIICSVLAPSRRKRRINTR